MNRVVITVVGKDSVGIIAAVCNALANHGVNILDISQTIVQDFFNMMMLTDISKCDVPFDILQEELKSAGDKKGVEVRCQREEIFTSMHRI